MKAFGLKSQQSRFLALVSNYDRYMEVANAAADAGDAGLLQYSKTLDSLETKLANISTSFQMFYMSILNGPFFSGVLDFVNNLIKGLNKLGNFSAIFNIAGIIKSVKLVGTTLVNSFSTATSGIRQQMIETFSEITKSIVEQMRTAGSDSAKAYAQGAVEGAAGTAGGQRKTISAKANKYANIAAGIGAVLSIGGTYASSKNATLGAGASMLGSAASYGVQGFMMSGGNPLVTGIAATVGLLTQVPALISAINNRLQEELDKAKENAEQKNLERAQASENYRNLQSTIENLKTLQAAQYDSEEAAKAYADAQAQAAETFPELITGYTAAGEAIVDVTSDTIDMENLLASARKTAAQATLDAAAAELNAANKQLQVSEANEYTQQEKQFLSFVSNGRFANSNLSLSEVVTWANDLISKRESDIESVSDADYISALEVLNSFEGIFFDIDSELGKAFNELGGIYSDENKNASYWTNVVEAGLAAWEKVTSPYTAQIQQDKALQLTYQKSQIYGYQELRQSLLPKNEIKDWQENENISNLIADLFFESISEENLADYFDSEGKLNIEKISEAYTGFIGNYEDFLNSLDEDSVEEFSDLISNLKKGKYSKIQLGEEIDKLSEFEDVPGDVQNALTNIIEQAQERFTSKISQVSTSFGDEEIGEIAEGLLEDIPTEFLDKIINFTDYVEQLLESETIDQSAAANWVKKYLSFIEGVLNNTELTPDQQSQAMSIITSGDMTTTSGMAAIQTELDKAGLGKTIQLFDESGNATVEPAAENLVVQYQDFATRMSTTFDSITSTLDKASKGFDISDAQKIATKMGKNVTEIFDFVEGSWFAKDISAITDAYFGDLETDRKRITDRLKEELADAEALGTGSAAKHKYAEAAAAKLNKSVEELTGEDIATYIQEVLDLTNAAYDEQLKWYKAELEYANKVYNASKGFKLSESQQRRLEAYDLLEQRGLSGYTDEDIGALITQFQIPEEAFTQAADGTYRISKEAWIKALGYSRQYVVDNFDAAMADQITSLTEESYSLFSTYGSAEKIPKSKLQDLFSPFFGYDLSAAALDAYLKFFITNTNENFETLQKSQEFAGLKREDYDRISANISAGINNFIIGKDEQILEYYQKILKGELTQDDINAMEEDADNIKTSLQGFIDKKDFSLYYTQVTNTYKKKMDDIVEAMTDYYVAALNSTRSDSLSVAQSIASPERMTADALGSFYGSLQRIFGDVNLLEQGFATFDSRTQTYRLNVTAIEEALTNLGDTITEDQREYYDSLISSMNFYNEWQKETAKSGMVSTIEDFVSATQISANDVKELYDSLLIVLSAEQAADIAQYLESLDPVERLQELVKLYESQEIHLDPAKYQELVATIFDQIIANISNSISSLAAGAEGTLNVSDYNQLVKQYGLSGTSRITSRGVKINSTEQAKVIAQMYQEAAAQGMTAEFGAQLWEELFSEQDEVFSGYKAIESAIEDSNKVLGESVELASAYAAALEQARNAAMFDPNAYEFSFMNQDGFKGLTENFDSFIGQISSVKTAFQSLSKKEYIDYQDFYNIFDFMQKQGQFDKFTAGTKAAGKSFEDFVISVISSSKKWGQVDIGGIAAEMGISVDTAMKSMGSGMQESLKQVAEEQYKYLDGLEKMLEALAAIEEIGDLDLGIDFEFSMDGTSTKVNDIRQLFDEFENLTTEEQKSKYLIKVQTMLNGSTAPGQKQLLEYVKQVTGKDTLDEVGLYLVDALATNIDFSAVADDANFWMQFAQVLSPDNLAKYLYTDGKLNANWQEILSGLIASIGTSFTNAIPEKIDVPWDKGTLTLNLTGEKEYTVVLAGTITEVDREALKQQISEQLALKNLEIDGGGLNFSESEEGTVVTFTTQVVSGDVEVPEVDIDTSKFDAGASAVSAEMAALGNLTATPVVSILVSGLTAAKNAISSLFSSNKNKNKDYLIESDTASAYTGTVNGIAMADGSIGRLYSGAQLAQKTLVGELGPELAVYDGQYHILGRKGAEFVKLPSDAIVFNHLQTAGILDGQLNIRGSAMAAGNVGPAAASGISSALSQVRKAKSVWQGLLNSLTVQELLGGGGGGGGGGSGNTITAVIEELEEWYNLSRQIANLEQEINNIIAERENMVDGGQYLRSLRQQQSLLQQQQNTQKILLEYQKLQLKRQADQINQNRIWSQFLTVDESGLLQYRVGNETNGGKGALQVLQQLNQMSGQEQVDFLKRIGYSYTDNDGKVLEGKELVEKFFEELQDQIDKYDELYDTVHETQQTLEELRTSIEEINEEIRKNQMDLESAIYDIIVDAWEAEIEQMEKQADIIKEANEAYIQGLNDALSAEKELYDQNQSIADREQLQRQLSLMRRSGGSASEIADLEKQLDSMLRDEYFNNQQQMIENIQDASEEQVRQLEEQITLQKEALDYQKENGVIWTKVYEVMSGTSEEILAFMQGHSTDFFSQSLLQQEEMLTDWAKKIGIYTEDRVYKNYSDFAKTNIWDTGNAWQYGNLSNFQNIYNSLSDADKQTIRDQYASVYANARMNGSDNETAATAAAESIYKILQARKEQQEAQTTKPPTTTPTAPATTQTSGGGGSGSGSGSAAQYVRVTYAITPAAAKASGCKFTGPSMIKVGSTGSVQVTAATGWARGGWSSSNTAIATILSGVITAKKAGNVVMTMNFWDRRSTTTTNNNAIQESDSGLFKNIAKKAYASGGLVDYTGTAAVHGTKSKPEAFLNAEQTAQIREGLEFSGNGKVLENLRSTINKLDSTIKGAITNISDVTTTTFTVAPGAVSIQVAELADSYDVEELSNDIMNRMVSIASKATNRGVSRR